MLGCEEQNDAFAKRLRGKTKYNLTYYLTPTEIFARSFEMYAYYVWGQRGSFLRETYGEEYDCSEESIKRIKAYFDKILKPFQ